MQVKQRGFTLLEVLIALFIFTILSVMLATGLHHIINVQSGVEANAERLRKLQMTLLVMSRDVEQAINRPILNSVGKKEAAFIGKPNEMIFTHGGFASAIENRSQSHLQRTRYLWKDNALWRANWDVLDQSTGSKLHEKMVLNAVQELRFEYIDQEGQVHQQWPLGGEGSEEVPRAVRLFLKLSNWGKLSQLYVISVERGKNTSTTSSTS